MTANNRRSGYTAIELMIVLGVMLILAAMTVPAVAASIRKTRISSAVNGVIDVARHARRLALERQATVDGGRYGVAIIHNPADDQGAWATLVYARPGDGKTSKQRMVTDPDGQPLNRQRFAPSCLVWVGDTPLKENALTEVSWFYDWRSGVPVRLDAAGFSSVPTTVGLSQITISNQWGMTGAYYNLVVPAVAASSVSGIPGLSFRSADGRIRKALAVYASSAINTADF